ncbi:serine hydrolase [Marinicella rhabdoformis]|uniref:serine hydrolase n=1 Tax=Marinicella rhabdoformis TaxID=2580566 RepID=UPI0015CFF7A2|nr:serine hydrolase [Marinicella rhabdoformis]
MKKILIIIFLLFTLCTNAKDLNVKKSMTGFDEYMAKVLADWNEPGAGVAIIHKGKLVYVEGFGYRDYGNKLPVTKNTLFQIASNTKLFTTVAAGMLVEEGTFKWDEPMKEAVPELNFYNDHLNNHVTLRDMLGHKTGISRHDMIWFQSDFNRKELFERTQFLKPSIPLRQDFIYNNLMYSAVGYSIELRTGKTWEAFVTEKILEPLDMDDTVFSIAEMQKTKDHGVPYDEKRDSTELYKIEIKEDGAGVGPAGSIITSLDDLSHWVIALMNEGDYKNKNVIPTSIIHETLKPGIAFRNSQLEDKGYNERLNSIYGMGREIEIYKGHVLTKHGGAMPGFHSQVVIMPYDDIGIITFSIGNQGARLGNTIIPYTLVDRLLDLEPTDWSERYLKDHLERKDLSKEGRSKAGFDLVENTSPTHELEHYTGHFSHEAYGEFIVSFENNELFFNFRRTVLPLTHYHFNRFDTPNDESFGKWSLNFNISPQGEISSATVSIDEGQITFDKKPDDSLSNLETLAQYVGKFEYAGSEIELKIKEGQLTLLGTTEDVLMPYKPHVFKIEKFADIQIEFVFKDKEVKGMQFKVPSGVYEYTKLEEDD